MPSWLGIRRGRMPSSFRPALRRSGNCASVLAPATPPWAIPSRTVAAIRFFPCGQFLLAMELYLGSFGLLTIGNSLASVVRSWLADRASRVMKSAADSPIARTSEAS